MLVIARDEPADSLYSSKRSLSESPDCAVIPGDPTTCTSSFESVEQFAAPECTSPTATMDPVTPAACSPVSYPALCGTIESELSLSNRAYTAKTKLMLQRLSSQPPVLFPVLVNEPTVFPWGGLTSTNTCPLDNWLMIFRL
ncbi:unnamed protein product [Porites evermanni]|uniref:Uncharacterized protein n=1 Tax=Porites evermanni TaxID=104178 RepID=A0ABN8SA14_9CNID|nr:unnamed protein product [Porites evermanni]